MKNENVVEIISNMISNIGYAKTKYDYYRIIDKSKKSKK